MEPTDKLEILADAAKYEKSVRRIKLAMGSIRRRIDEKAQEPRAPAGQGTQMIVGADASDDQTILSTAETLYGSYKLKRVYYSAFSPIPQSAPFIVTADYSPAAGAASSEVLRRSLAQAPQQMNLWQDLQAA